ncbi:VCBS repeat-containing protein [Gilvibacter sediminis]|uniref:VCBS repeat-containing protein n=1 Tax=Gilvibacter sediminis TaxID=379071 RepID=UPI0023509100|nr:VCBS repeat-containing protein [Gilvibacter sediminis]MDC7997613.1 VCBS repeat-containing protein [Gilvibacter sediminis]
MTRIGMLLLAVLSLVFVACEDSNKEKEQTAKATTKKPKDEAKEARKALFELLPANQTGINFSNTLVDDVSTMENLFNFDYFYNGAGVAVADLNGDGLEDIFFAGNQQPNKLYKNLGDLKFEDVSEAAKINEGKVWANGVTVADVNNDGLLDIYVSQGGPKQKEDRENLLFINKGNFQFEESAKAYGLNDQGISTQAAFFDYDKDGDLDCVVSNENEFYGLDPQRFFATIDKNDANLYNSSTHLYRNDGGRFTDVTKRAGVLNASFGLGLSVSDINQDGWLDIYVANDYYVPDALYLNQGDGTFKNQVKETTKQVSFYGMGVDIDDLNNDGLKDIFVLDMASSDHIRSKTLMASMNEERFSLLVDTYDMPYQYMYNSVQLNQGDAKFINVAQQTKMAKTDWSWAGLITDYDLDGNKDIYVTNGYRRYALDNDLRRQVAEVQRAYAGQVPVEVKKQLYDAMPSEKLSNIMFWNKGDLAFENQAYQWGLANPSFSNGAVYADLDNDGDLELVVNNIDETAFVYKNTAVERGLNNFITVKTEGKLSEAFPQIFLTQNSGNTQLIEAKRVRGYLSATTNSASFGIGKDTQVAEVKVLWPSGKQEIRTDIAANSTLTFKEADATDSGRNVNPSQAMLKATASTMGLDFQHKENDYNDFSLEVLLPYKQSTMGPFMATADINGDGLEDVFVGGAAGQSAYLFKQTQSGFSRVRVPAFTADAEAEDMKAVFFDADGDSDMDLYVVSGGNAFAQGSIKYTDRLYLNDGQGGFTKSENAVLGAFKQSGHAVAALDFDQDGDMDLMVGNRMLPQQYPQAAPSYLLKNDGNGQFTPAGTAAFSDAANLGLVNDLLVTDFDNDGWSDLIVATEWDAVKMYRNNQGSFEAYQGVAGLADQKGWWFSVSETDINKDGKPDYILGNLGVNSKYKATESTPLKVYGYDFDDNGSFDLVLSSKYNGRDVPVRGRECSSQQMPFIAQKFETYAAFANASLQDIYGAKLNSAYQREVNQFHSMVMLSNSAGGHDLIELPAYAQTAPVLGGITVDVASDGTPAFVAVGNIYNTEVETPRMDMGTGMVLQWQDGSFKASGGPSTFYVEGDAKSITAIDHKGTGKTLVLVGRNNGPLGVFELVKS